MKFTSLKTNLVLNFLCIGLLPVLILAIVSYIQSRDTIEQQSFAQLSAVNAIKKRTISDYFESIASQVETYSDNLMIVDAMRDLGDSFADIAETNQYDNAALSDMETSLHGYYEREFAREYANQNDGEPIDVSAMLTGLSQESVVAQSLYISSNANALGSKHLLDSANDDSEYSHYHETYHPIIRQYLEQFGYYDIFLVDIDTGNIVYSVFKELDYGTSLLDGPFADSNLARVFKKAAEARSADEYFFEDFQPYLPSYDNAASFIASPIYEEGRKTGVLIFQMPIDRINAVMSERSGMGESGESYLVGGDKLMRSDSYLDPINHSVVASFRNPDLGIVDTDATNAALAGETDTSVIVDYNGNPVLSSYAPIDILGQSWAIISEIDEAEAMAGVAALQRLSILVFSIVAVVAAIIGYLVASSIARPVIKVSKAIQEVAGGRLDQQIDVRRKDEIGQLATAMQTMQQQLKEVIEYGVQPMVSKAGHGDLSDRLSLAGKQGFYFDLSNSINELIQVNETFLTETARVASALAEGDLHTVSEAQFSGTFAEVQADIEKMRKNLAQVIGVDVQAIVDAAGNGDLSRRIELADKAGFYRDLSQAINKLVDENQAIINDTLDVTRELSVGRLDKVINRSYAGSFAELKHNLQAMQSKLTQVIKNEIHAIVKAASEGNLKERIRLDDKQGFYHELSSSINELVNASDEIISDTSRVMGAMAAGNLTETIDREYLGSFNDLKLNINKTVGKLTETVTEIQSAASVVRHGSEEITDGTTNLSQRTEEQAASLEETASAMEEITVNVQNNASNSEQAESLTRSASELAEQGGEVMGKAVHSMRAISDSGKEIDNIINVIDEIAFQTNLLALNASVEAARAGEHGRGFAVVADEVRELAGRCAGAANQVKTIIQDSNSRIDEGSKLVNESGEMLGRIVDSVKQVRDIVAEISMASGEQSKGLEEINKAVTEMDTMTQQNAALVEQTAAACESLGDKSRLLDELIAFFRTRGEAVHTRPALTLAVRN